MSDARIFANSKVTASEICDDVATLLLSETSGGYRECADSSFCQSFGKSIALTTSQSALNSTCWSQVRGWRLIVPLTPKWQALSGMLKLLSEASGIEVVCFVWIVY